MSIGFFNLLTVYRRLKFNKYKFCVLSLSGNKKCGRFDKKAGDLQRRGKSVVYHKIFIQPISELTQSMEAVKLFEYFKTVALLTCFVSLQVVLRILHFGTDPDPRILASD